MKVLMKKTLVLVAAVLGVALFVSGCGPQVNRVDAPTTSMEQSQASSSRHSSAFTNEAESRAASYEHMVEIDAKTRSALMEELPAVTTVEEANELIGSEGKKTGENWYKSPYDPPAVVSTMTEYTWFMGDGTLLTGAFTVYEVGGQDYRTFDTYYPSDEIEDKATFANLDEIRERLDSAEGLRYDQLVELLGGVEGLRETTSTVENTTYFWVDDSYACLWCDVDANGMCEPTSLWVEGQ